MSDVLRLPFVDSKPGQTGNNLKPLLELILSNRGNQITATGLLDTGADVNVMPYSVGEKLGFEWDKQNIPVVLSGNMARLPARGILVSTGVAQFRPVQLAFAWTQIDDVPLILGMTNFFMEFDVCFFRSRMELEVKLKM